MEQIHEIKFFKKIISTSLQNKKYTNILQAKFIDTPLGPMLAIADKKNLYLLEFTDSKSLEKKIARLCKDIKANITMGTNASITSTQNELSLYFAGTLKNFNTPIYMLGTDFQQKAWSHLTKVPYAKTSTYKKQAQIIDKPTACRAVANANAANRLAIIIPCHRIINSNGMLGGYAGGLARKQWLLAHEERHQA